MTQQTLTRLRNLKLTGMADAVQQQLEQASTYEGLPFITVKYLAPQALQGLLRSPQCQVFVDDKRLSSLMARREADDLTSKSVHLSKNDRYYYNRSD